MLNRPANGTDTGETVASMREYEAAQKTVSKLIAGEVPARDIAIIGQSVRTVERVTGRLGYAAAARSGAINGVLIGLFLAAILVIGQPEVPIQLFVGFVLIGVAVGMLLSLITYAIVRRRRDFASITQFAADHYEVTVMPSSLAKARQVLGAVTPQTTRPPMNLDEPPRYGERVVPGATPVAPSPGTDPGAEGYVVPPRPAAPMYGERVVPASTDAPAPAPVPAPAPAEAAPAVPTAAVETSSAPAAEEAAAPESESPRPAGRESAADS